MFFDEKIKNEDCGDLINLKKVALASSLIFNRNNNNENFFFANSLFR